MPESSEKNIAVLIPAYDPDPSMAEMASRLKELGFLVCIVNDGSSKGHEKIFASAEQNAVILRHKKNMGKGFALKTGINYLKKHEPQLKGFVTADADGQHAIKDIQKVAEVLESFDGIVLGTRDLKNAPARSMFGNDLSRITYAIFTGKIISDNQTGLRGFSMHLCDWLLGIEGKYYEYEMSVLVRAAKEGVEISTVPIETIYHNGNAGTHFKPVLDTIRIQKSIIKNALFYRPQKKG